MIVYVFLLLVFAWAYGMMVADALCTARGIAGGFAVEGNSLIVWLVGNKPTLEQFILIESPLRLGLLAMGLITTHGYYPHALTVIAIAALVAYGFKSLTGVLAWKKLEE